MKCFTVLVTYTGQGSLDNYFVAVKNGDRLSQFAK